MDLTSGTMLGKYEVLRKIATGGMAEIFLARARGQAGFEKLVVIKRIRPQVADDPDFVTMLLDEARIVASLQHPNIADVYEVGEDAGSPFFVMELVHGQDVRSIRSAANERSQSVPIGISLAIAHAVAAALDYAHRRVGSDGENLNLVHRDVSASNVLVGYHGAIKLIDFGIASVRKKSHNTEAGTVKGKYPYMSPEQCRGLPLDSRSDLFSLGVVTYEMTVGRRPFEGASEFDIMDKIVNDGAPPPSTLATGYPPELEAIVMKLLARDREKRYQSAEAFLRDLDTFLDAQQLWIAPHRMSRYMRTLFADRIASWEAFSRGGDVTTVVAQIAMAMEQPTQVKSTNVRPVVMQLSKALHSVGMDTARSIMPMRADEVETSHPRRARTAVDLDEPPTSSAKPNTDVAKASTGKPDALPSSGDVDHMGAEPAGAGDTVTVSTGAGDTVTVSTGAGDTVTVSAGAGDTVTVRTGAVEVHGDSIVFGDSITLPFSPSSVDTLMRAREGRAGVARVTESPVESPVPASAFARREATQEHPAPPPPRLSGVHPLRASTAAPPEQRASATHTAPQPQPQPPTGTERRSGAENKLAERRPPGTWVMALGLVIAGLVIAVAVGMLGR